ncbi:hypothetical protein FKM82_001724 [Ascaphus truei]
MVFKDALRIAFFAALSLTRSRTYPPPEPQAAFAQRYLGFRLFYCCRLLTRPQRPLGNRPWQWTGPRLLPCSLCVTHCKP